jgi:predicted nucleic acid-binding protein
MRVYFADTCFFVGLCNPTDDLHRVASEWYALIGPTDQIITTELVIVELLNYVAKLGQLRHKGLELVERLKAKPNVEIIGHSSQRFSHAQQLYADRRDMEWSLTDCDSMLAMRARKTRDALTHDHHFEQNGMVALLRR